mmetsp:Transcript_19386/g.63033  ORF Transcript_19386/g.63033 Transcript_19386/m.63033 type:complete len:231 (+) Transcript_19386:401-1093(+)
MRLTARGSLGSGHPPLFPFAKMEWLATCIKRSSISNTFLAVPDEVYGPGFHSCAKCTTTSISGRTRCGVAHVEAAMASSLAVISKMDPNKRFRQSVMSFSPSLHHHGFGLCSLMKASAHRTTSMLRPTMPSSTMTITCFPIKFAKRRLAALVSPVGSGAVRKSCRAGATSAEVERSRAAAASSSPAMSCVVSSSSREASASGAFMYTSERMCARNAPIRGSLFGVAASAR